MSACDAFTPRNSFSIVHPEFKNGIARFKTASQFKEFLKEIESPEAEQSFEVFAEENGFRSLTSKNSVEFDPIYRSNSKNKSIYDDQDPVEIVEDQYFATVINDQGLVYVEGNYIRVTRDYVFWHGSENPDVLLDDGYLVELTSKIPSVQKSVSVVPEEEGYYFDDSRKIYYGEVVRSVPVSESTGSDPVAGPVIPSPAPSIPSYSTFPYAKNKRIVYETWNTNWLLYASFGSLTKHQTKYILWVRSDTDWLYVESEASWNIKIPNSVVKGDTRDSTIYSIDKKSSHRRIAKVRHDFSVAVITSVFNFDGTLGGSVKKTVKGYKVNYVKGKHEAKVPTWYNFGTQLVY